MGYSRRGALLLAIVVPIVGCSIAYMDKNNIFPERTCLIKTFLLSKYEKNGWKVIGWRKDGVKWVLTYRLAM